MQVARTEQMTQVMEQLTSQYTFTEEEAATINDVDSKPSEYLPKLLAKAHMNALVQSQQMLRKTVPDMVTETSQQNIASSKAEDSFFSRWPDLKGHEEKAFASIQAYKSVNPDADMAGIIEGAGTLAMISVGKSLEGSNTPDKEVVIPDPPPPPAGTGGGTGETGRSPASYEERVFDQLVNEDRNLARG